jgi:hypothetical protein
MASNDLKMKNILNADGLAGSGCGTFQSTTQ